MTAPATGPILLVEDDAMLREMMAFMLSTRGYGVVEAGAGEEAIQVLDGQGGETGFSLVLLDMMLPGVDGIGVLKHISQNASKVPVVAMSAGHNILTAAEQAGAQATIAKPFDMPMLLNVVEQHLAL